MKRIITNRFDCGTHLYCFDTGIIVFAVAKHVCRDFCDFVSEGQRDPIGSFLSCVEEGISAAGDVVVKGKLFGIDGNTRESSAIDKRVGANGRQIDRQGNACEGSTISKGRAADGLKSVRKRNLGY